ncbi:hypothetical protein OH76DRAFT_993336 [Lentinus brumalis]|uniref:Uncharacterized protein n=1 Tax=Lentinus brumalis TaxID=2498619 RepID=A0A371DQC0_9APHY|nr:hypothetical protein OH76DRAFT_993336 [Polyporus brumalis]
MCISGEQGERKRHQILARERAPLRPPSGVESCVAEELARGCPGWGSEEGMHATWVGALYAPLWFTYECIAPPCLRLAVSPPPSPAGLSSRLQGQLGPLVLRSVDDDSVLATDDSEHLFTFSRPLAPGRLPRAASCELRYGQTWESRGRAVLRMPSNPAL